MDKKDAHEILAKNLKALMDSKRFSAPDLQEKSGVGRSTINNILNQSYSATTDTVQKLSRTFKLPVWALYIPNLDITLKGQDLDSLISCYLSADPDGRSAVLRFALSEARQAQQPT